MHTITLPLLPLTLLLLPPPPAYLEGSTFSPSGFKSKKSRAAPLSGCTHTPRSAQADMLRDLCLMCK